MSPITLNYKYCVRKYKHFTINYYSRSICIMCTEYNEKDFKIIKEYKIKTVRKY